MDKTFIVVFALFGFILIAIACSAEYDYGSYPNHHEAVIFGERLAEEDPRRVSLCLVFDSEYEYSYDDRTLIARAVVDATEKFGPFGLNFYIPLYAKAELRDSGNLWYFENYISAYRKQFLEKYEIRCDILFVVSSKEYFSGDIEAGGLGSPKVNGIFIFAFRVRTFEGLSEGIQHELGHVFGAEHTTGIRGNAMDTAYSGTEWDDKNFERIMKNRDKFK